MNKLFPILGLGAGALLILGSKKSASAATGGNATANPTAKQKTKAEWTAIIAHSLNNDSYEDYVKVLTEAYKTGLFKQSEIAAYQKKHKNFPKAGSGSSTTAAKPKTSDLDKRIATALATNNPATIRALADELERTSPEVPEATIAALRKAADDLDAALKAGQETAPPVTPPVAPPPVSVARPKPAPVVTPPPTAVVYKPEEHAPKPAADSRAMAIDLAKHLTGRKKGTEDKAKIEAYQRNENRIRVANDQSQGLNPDGRYGLETAMSLGRYDLVPPKPLYWGKGDDYKSFLAEKKQWKEWCLMNAAKDPARKAEWTGASKV